MSLARAITPKRARRARAGVLALGVWLMQGAAQAGPPETSAEHWEDLPSPDELDATTEPVPELDAAVETSPPSDDDGEPSEDESSVERESKPSESEPAPKLDIKTLNKPKWIKHEIVPGERLEQIADRYKVRRESLIRWNKLDADKPKLYAGRELAVYTKFIPPPQQKITYTVQYGDTWPKIAAAYHVDEDDLRIRWNPKVPRKFKAGQEIVIWLDPLRDPSVLEADAHTETRSKASAGTSVAASASRATTAAAKLPLAAVKSGSISVGKPNRGKIVNGIVLPENKALYTIRKPDEAFGSTHTLHNLQLAIANFRQTSGYAGQVIIGAISKAGGGRLRPHSSHQSGRDVDIRLPLRNANGSSDNIDDVDWDATWSLILALVSTGEVQYIFMSSSRQKHLYKAAKRAGASKDLLERVLQYPNKSGTNNGIVRDEAGHTAHFHVRFTCAANETRCESY